MEKFLGNFTNFPKEEIFFKERKIHNIGLKQLLIYVKMNLLLNIKIITIIITTQGKMEELHIQYGPCVILYNSFVPVPAHNVTNFGSHLILENTVEIVKSNNFLYVAENCDKVIFSRRKRFYKTKRKWFGLHLVSLDTFVDNPSGKIHDQKCK